MEPVQTRCSICGGTMQEGFFLDITHRQIPTRWVEGKPARTIMGFTAFSDRPNYFTTAYRCEKCGHLELFAIDQAVH
ncbi:MAG: PF20097 family protein [bacterium]